MPTVGNDRLVYLHVPKTGGKWAVKAMQAAGVELEPEGNHWAGHPRLRDLDIRDRFTFAFVRQPFEWYRSVWCHDRTWNQRSDNWPHRHIPLPFPEYLEACIRERPGFLRTYYAGFVGARRNPIDFTGRYENLVDDLVMALTLAGQEFDEEALRAFPKINCSGPPPECPEGLRERLRESEAAVYERFYAPVLA